MRYANCQLPPGDCIEVYCTEPGRKDGKLLGYAIFFSGGWDGWQITWPGTHMFKVASDEPTAEDAIRKIVDERTDQHGSEEAQGVAGV